MKNWTQDMLPLKIIKDLGLAKATPKSKTLTRFIEFQCPNCSNTFRAEPSKVKNLVKTQCTPCSTSARHVSTVDPITGLKNCSDCKEEKAINEFYSNTRRHDGLDSRCKTCMDSYKKTWTETTEIDLKTQRENSRLLKRYGITSNDYLKLLEKQGHQCAICGNTPETGRGNSTKLSVDHCHTTGRIRGLLCQKCNTGLGLLGDTSEGLQKAINYLGTE